MSPNPKRDIFGGIASKSIGKRILIGAFKFLATVSITSVP